MTLKQIIEFSNKAKPPVIIDDEALTAIALGKNWDILIGEADFDSEDDSVSMFDLGFDLCACAVRQGANIYSVKFHDENSGAEPHTLYFIGSKASVLKRLKAVSN